VQFLGGATAMAVDAAACLVSALLLVVLRLPAPTRIESRSRAGPALRRGLSVVRANPLLWRITVAGATLNAGGAALGALYVLYCYRYLELAPAQVAVTFGAYSVATLVGVALAPRLDRRVPLDRVLRLAAPLAAGALLLIPAASLGAPVPVLVAYQLLFGFGAAIWSIGVITLQQREVPAAQLGTVLALTRSLGVAAVPLGAIAGGVLAQVWAVRPVLVGAALVSAVGTVAVLYLGGRR
jgi:predicted MFS family arabinose efflux permease